MIQTIIILCLVAVGFLISWGILSISPTKEERLQRVIDNTHYVNHTEDGATVTCVYVYSQLKTCVRGDK